MVAILEGTNKPAVWYVLLLLLLLLLLMFV